MDELEKITLAELNPQNYKFKIKHSARRMKLYIKLTKEETDGWNNIKTAISGGQAISDDNLAKLLFFLGINNIMEELNEKINNMSEEEKAKALAEYEKEAKGTDEESNADSEKAAD